MAGKTIGEITIMDIFEIIEIFALVTGIPYIVLEVLQKNAMWYFGIATGIACAYSFGVQHLWSNMGLNIYYVVMSVWGLHQWRKDSGLLDSAKTDGGAPAVHLSHLTARIAVCSLLTFIVCTAFMVTVFSRAADPNVWMDAVSTSMCAVAMFWLGKSIPYHWLIWIVADSILVVMCAMEQSWWLAALYLAYVLAACVGLVHWRRKGAYVD